MTVKSAMIGLALALAAVPGCVPWHVVGPLRHERDERERLLVRSRASGVSVELLNTVVPPLTPEEDQAMQKQTDSCRTAYLWKNGLTWTGGGLVSSLTSASFSRSGLL